MTKRRVSRDFIYSDNFKLWSWFVAQTLASAIVGALIAFVFGSDYWAALAALATLLTFLVVLTAVFIWLENQVSVLSIMRQGLKDGKYEDVIKFGSAMRATLFSANRNSEIVLLGQKIDEAASRIESDHYNRSKGDYPVTIDGSQQSITQIRIGLKVDDLGWSMHLARRTDEAATNILDGIRRARNEALRLSRIRGERAGTAVTPYVRLILRGYRHLCGIYFEDVSQNWRARFYEDATGLIMSQGRSLRASEHHTDPLRDVGAETVLGLPYEGLVERARTWILNSYFAGCRETESPVTTSSSEVQALLKRSRVKLMDALEIEDDIKLFAMTPLASRTEMIKDQCYAWGRNLVKQAGSRLLRDQPSEFRSDAEFSWMVAEARAFSQAYYYGTDPVTSIDDFDRVISKDVLGKSELRYLSLINEIDLASLLHPSSRERRERGDRSGGSPKVDDVVDRLKATREIFRDRRADLYVRASTHLITAHYYDYVFNSRSKKIHPQGPAPESEKERFRRYKRAITSVYREITNFERRADEGLDDHYRSAVKALKQAREQNRRRYGLARGRPAGQMIALFANIDKAEFQGHAELQGLRSAAHQFGEDEIAQVRVRWGGQ